MCVVWYVCVCVCAISICVGVVPVHTALYSYLVAWEQNASWCEVESCEMAYMRSHCDFHSAVVISLHQAWKGWVSPKLILYYLLMSIDGGQECFGMLGMWCEIPRASLHNGARSRSKFCPCDIVPQHQQPPFSRQVCNNNVESGEGAPVSDSISENKVRWLILNKLISYEYHGKLTIWVFIYRSSSGTWYEGSSICVQIVLILKSVCPPRRADSFSWKLSRSSNADKEMWLTRRISTDCRCDNQSVNTKTSQTPKHELCAC